MSLESNLRQDLARVIAQAVRFAQLRQWSDAIARARVALSHPHADESRRLQLRNLIAKWTQSLDDQRAHLEARRKQKIRQAEDDAKQPLPALPE